MATTKSLVNNIKRELKKQKISYADLGIKLDIAESTVKKMFAKGNFSLDRLDQICNILGVDLLEMVENPNEEVTRISSFTVHQERQLLKDPTLLLAAYAAINYWTIDDILYRYEVRQEDVIERLKTLQDFGMLQLRNNNRIRPLVSNNFQWLPDGPLSQYFQENFLESFFNHDFQESGALRVIRFGDMTETSRKKLERKSLELVDLYDQLTYNDRHYRPGDRERKNVSMVIAHRTWTITPWEGFIKDKKNPANML